MQSQSHEIHQTRIELVLIDAQTEVAPITAI